MSFRENVRPYTRAIFALALPIILENLLQTLLGTTDTYFAGQLNDYAIAGISVTTLVMNLFISLFTAVRGGPPAVIPRHVGRGDLPAVRSCIAHALLLSVLLGSVVGAIYAGLRTPILRLCGADDAVIASAMPYYLIVTLPSMVLCLQLTLSSCLRAIRDTRTPLWATGLSNLLNILLNGLFIRIGWGVFGLGLATTLSRVIGTVLLFVRLNRHHPDVRPTRCKLQRHIFASLLSIGVPAGMEKLIMRIGQLIYNGMILSLGVHAYVAHNIAGAIESYAYIPAMGFGLALCTLMGICLGEEDVRKAKALTYHMYLLSTACMLAIAVVIYAFAPSLAALFTQTVPVRDLVVRVLRIIACFQPFSALVHTMTSALQGAGDTRFPMLTTLLGIWGIRIGIGKLLAVNLQWGLIGFWSAYALDMVVRGLLLLLRFLRGRWQQIAV